MKHTTEAGRELDARIAEEVMGWAAVQNETRRGTYAYWRSDGEFTGYQVQDDSYLFDYDVPYFQPSTSIADAWEVVRGLKERGLRVRVEEFSDGWYVAFGMVAEEREFDFTHAVADTAPLSICLAALEAVK